MQPPVNRLRARRAKTREGPAVRIAAEGTEGADGPIARVTADAKDDRPLLLHRLVLRRARALVQLLEASRLRAADGR
eukprot:5020110-Prymnesium_polylepis.1